jgi:hypothetical protein
MTTVQVFCTIAELVESLPGLTGGDEAVLRRHIGASSEFLAKEIGWFIPVTETLSVDGTGKEYLVIPPMLAITTLLHDGTTLSTPADYLLYPSGREWLNGPYSWLQIAEGGQLNCWKAEAQVVSLAGRRGLYELVGSTGTQLSAQQLIGDAALLVKDGSKLSPGMVVKLTDEQALVTATGAPTASTTTVSVAVAAADVELTLADETKVNVGEIIRLGFEQCKILDKNSTSHKVSVIRGYNNTLKTTHAISTPVDVYRTFAVTRAVNGTVAAAHAADLAIDRYQVPEDLGFLAREIAGLMLKKEQSGYAGRTGNVELGTVFYNDAFPRDDLAKIKKNYTIKGQ